MPSRSSSSRAEPIEVRPETARRWLVAHMGLLRPTYAPGPDGVRAVLQDLRCIQLDPLDRIGTNADLVAAARVDGLQAGEVYDALLPGHAFEHFAKERCLLPARIFPWYREREVQAWWWRLGDRTARIDPDLVTDVLAEVEERGPVTADELEQRGRVEPLDWNGWRGTSSANRMALEILWTRCQVVVHSRTPGGKRYDVPWRALPEVHDAPAPGTFDDVAFLERVEAAGLLATAVGPWWSTLRQPRRELIERHLALGTIELVRIEGSRRTWIAPANHRDREVPSEDDGRMRILGPLDPLLWNRDLVRHVFDFDYVWEVYKPADKRRWGFYVCPLLHGDRLVGRIEAHVESGELVVDRLWEEPGGVDQQALADALDRHRVFLLGA